MLQIQKQPWGAWIGITAVLALFLLPIFYLASVSFKTPDDVLSGNFLPTVVTFTNWPTAFATIPLSSFILNSVISATLSSLLALGITLPAAYAIYRLEIAKTWLPQLVLGSFLAPPVVALLPLFYLLKVIKLINTPLGLGLVYGLANVPVALWLLAPFFSRIPREIEEAARIDGANNWNLFWRIVLPLVSHGTAATAVVIFILSYNEFLLASILTFDERSRTLTVGISLYQGERLQNFGQMAAASFAGLVPVYTLAILAQRWLVDGLTAGAVKS